jgi:hypothetical protein
MFRAMKKGKGMRRKGQTQCGERTKQEKNEGVILGRRPATSRSDYTNPYTSTI